MPGDHISDEMRDVVEEIAHRAATREASRLREAGRGSNPGGFSPGEGFQNGSVKQFDRT